MRERTSSRLCFRCDSVTRSVTECCSVGTRPLVFKTSTKDAISRQLNSSLACALMPTRRASVLITMCPRSPTGQMPLLTSVPAHWLSCYTLSTFGALGYVSQVTTTHSQDASTEFLIRPSPSVWGELCCMRRRLLHYRKAARSPSRYFGPKTLWGFLPSCHVHTTYHIQVVSPPYEPPL